MATDLGAKDRELGRDCYYERTVQRQPRAALRGPAQTEVLIIGGGLAGLSCALDLAERGRQVMLLEAGSLCSQASGRNGGQMIAGYACGQPALESMLGMPDAQRLWQLSIASLALMRERMKRYAIDCHPTWSYLTVADRPRKARALREEADHMRRQYGHDMHYLEGADLRRHVASAAYVAGLVDPASGHTNPLQYGLGLADAAQTLGAALHEQSAVLSLRRNGKSWEAQTADATVRAEQVLLAGNCGLLWRAPGLVPALRSRIMPVGTYMVATEPLPETIVQTILPTRAAVCDNNFILDYFRLAPDRRLLFGGRVSYTTATPGRLTEVMRQRMVSVFPEVAGARIEHTWGGFVDISRERAPDWGQLDRGLYYVHGFSGHGVVPTTVAGRVVAEAICGQPEALAVFERIQQKPFPGGAALRVPLLLLGTAYLRLRDWLS